MSICTLMFALAPHPIGRTVCSLTDYDVDIFNATKRTTF